MSYELYVFLNWYWISFFIATYTNQYTKKRKLGKSPEKDIKNDNQVATTMRKTFTVSKTGQKKAKIKKSGKKVLVRIVYICNFYVPFLTNSF